MARPFFARLGRFALVIAAAAGLSACGVNTVPTAEENAKARWADVESAYQRRAALIPNLVATAKGAAASETQILTNVTNARAAATSINITTDDLSDPATFERFQNAQNQLTQALGQLRTAEAVLVDLGYPMGPVIASIHEKRDEFRAQIMEEGQLSEKPPLKSAGLRERQA